MLIKPVGLTKDMTVIDITAGLGERLLRAHHEFKADVTGMDIDSETALRGTELLKPYLSPKVAGISAYTLPNLVIAKKFDCLFAREIFYRVADKPKFFQLVAGYSTALGQLSYTDYIVDPENRDRPAVRAWIQNEKGINPLGLVENAEAWAKAGFNLRVYDDQTAMYKAEIMKGILRFSNFIAANRPDLATKRAILKHMDLWGRRVAAIEQGLKFYRIYGIKA
jgi:cyclopropane fatty-acyl-phospholipid synthase-like methyltransferase